MASTSSRKLLVIGLDGADLEYMRPWLAAGDLPNLSALTEQGSLMPLRSLLLNLTHVVWPAFFTGKNPGKTGLVDVMIRQRGKYEFVPNNLATWVKTEPFWAYLKEAGMRTIVINVPATYPPVPLNGLMVTGFDTPQQAASYAWPEELQTSLDQRRYREDVLDLQHELTVRAMIMRRTQHTDSYVADCEKFTNRFTAEVLNLLEQNKWDAAFVGYQLTDLVSHFTADAEMHRAIYQMADRMVGRLLEQAGEDAAVIVVSDHGSMEPTRCISLTKILLDNGFIKFKPEIAADVLPWVLVSLLPQRWNNLDTHAGITRVWSRLPGWMRRTLSWLPLRRYPGWAQHLSNVEWRATKAYIFAPASRTIYINRSDVVPEAPISPGTEHDELCEQIKAAFEAVIDPETGKQVFAVKRIPHIWQGPFIDEIAPDLILEILDDRYFLQMSDPRGRLFWNEEPGALGGAHRYDGLALFKGEGIQEGVRLPTAGILDVIPTLLYLMGIALPQNLDGKVIEGAIEPSYLKAHPIQLESEPRPEFYRPELEAGYSQEELESVMQKFRALGYVE